MKNKIIIIIIIIACLFLWGFLLKESKDADIPDIKITIKKCYVNEETKTYLEIKNTDGKIEGIYKKNNLVGSLEGVSDSNFLNVIYTEKNNILNKEQKIFKIYKDLVIESLSQRKKEVAGVKVYADINSVVFGDDGIITKTSCK